MKLDAARSGRLSPREHQVMELLATGKNCKEISRDLSISKWTVKTHLARIRQKLGVMTNVEAIHQLTKSGQI